MRKAFSPQMRFDCQPVPDVRLNVNCRDELVPILRGLQHIYSQPLVRDQILSLVAKDVNGLSRKDRGRTGLSYWEITVLAAVRLGCNLDYDKLQDLAEQHRALRQIMGVGDWSDQLDDRFNGRRIRDNVCLLRPETIEAISHHIVDLGHCIDPEAVKQVRADSFVVETNIHYPTESSLIVDGLRKTIEMCVTLSKTFGIAGWRQHQQLLKRVKKTARQISRIGARQGAKYKPRLEAQYRVLLRRANQILQRAKELCQQFEKNYVRDFAAVSEIAGIRVYIERTEHVCGTARRRVLEGATVPNQEKLFSMFEPHTQLYKRGKAGRPLQFGRLVLVYEDAAGFMTHHHIMPRDAQDQDVLIEQTRKLQTRLDNQIEEGSFDRGFHSPENQQQLAEIIDHPCLPKPGPKQAAAQQAQASVKFHQARQRHPGVESAIGALQSGNGLVRCRDGTEEGFERYVALGILGRNLHVLGKLLIAREHESAPAAHTKRAAA